MLRFPHRSAPTAHASLCGAHLATSACSLSKSIIRDAFMRFWKCAYLTYRLTCGRQCLSVPTSYRSAIGSTRADMWTRRYAHGYEDVLGLGEFLRPVNRSDCAVYGLVANSTCHCTRHALLKKMRARDHMRTRHDRGRSIDDPIAPSRNADKNQNGPAPHKLQESAAQLASRLRCAA